jgi:hypothetical protein
MYLVLAERLNVPSSQSRDHHDQMFSSSEVDHITFQFGSQSKLFVNSIPVGKLYLTDDTRLTLELKL